MVAEFLSVLKRTFSRVLVIIVAVGYGIVRPRLGSLKQKIGAIGLLYFVVASTEAMLRINAKLDEANRKVLLSKLALVIIDSIIYYWIFTNLLKTTQSLRMKRNIVKLNVYRQFTNTLLFSILISLVFMIWSLKSNYFTDCITGWRHFWVNRSVASFDCPIFERRHSSSSTTLSGTFSSL